MVRILKYIKRREWAVLLASAVFIAAQVWLELKMPDYMASITQHIQTESGNIGEILKAGAYMLLCALGSLVSSCIVGFFTARIGSGFSMRLRAEVFEKTLSFSMEEIGNFSIASLITRSTNDITQVQMIIAMGSQVIIKAPILAVWAIVKITGKSWQWTLATGLSVALLLVMFSVIILFALPKFRVIQKLTDNLNRVTRENLTGLRVVRAYNAEKYEEDKFEKANEELTYTHLFISRIMAIMMPCISLVLSGLSLAIYWIGAYIIDGAASIPEKITLFSDMVVFSAYAMQVIMAFMMLTMIFIILPRAGVSAKRILEVLETKARIKDGHITDPDNGKAGEIEFRNVSFKYPDSADYVLRDISFSAQKGETVAIIGATGSGKSTLINLIPRFYDATEGEVLVNGIDVKEYKQEALHNKLGYVPQRAVMFSGTVRSNIGYGGKSGSEESLSKAAEIAQATEFIENMEGGYEASISQGGTNISGGQKQRLAIARAIYRKPEIYIFDDTFSALDYKTDRALRSALKRETKDATSLIVAQRIGTIKDADKIIVLEEGRIAGIGRHGELLRNCPLYLEIAQSQFSKEEIESEQD